MQEEDAWSGDAARAEGGGGGAAARGRRGWWAMVGDGVNDAPRAGGRRRGHGHQRRQWTPPAKGRLRHPPSETGSARWGGITPTKTSATVGCCRPWGCKQDFLPLQPFLVKKATLFAELGVACYQNSQGKQDDILST